MTRGRAILIAVAAVVIAFGSGFGWQYTRARRLEGQLAVVERRLDFMTMEATLAAAAVTAQRGGHDEALRMTSEFFTALQQREALAPPETREQLAAILAQRDATISQLARSDPAAADHLARLLAAYRVAVGGPERALPVAAPPADPEK
jgi:hypothetical protein